MKGIVSEVIDRQQVVMGQMQAEIERLRAIVDRVPKTADGVLVLPGDSVWHVRRNIYCGVVTLLDSDGHIETTAHGDAPDACYHDYAAAQVALENRMLKADA